jgi:pre-rRNA-processing protein TSR3
MDTLIIRHVKENKKKCTLQPLVGKEGFQFFTYPRLTSLPSLQSYVVLTLEAEEVLSPADADKGLLVIDGTWRYANEMYISLLKNGPLLTRSLPAHFKTAYPRKQTGCSDPDRGLASIEALFIAYKCLRREADSLLDAYYFKEVFLKDNSF